MTQDATHGRFRRWLALAMLAIGVVALGLGFSLAEPWFKALTPRWAIRSSAIGMGYAVMIIQVFLIVASPLMIGLGIVHIRKAHRQRRPWQRPARLVLLGFSCLFAAGVAELGAGVRLAWIHRAPRLPHRFVQPPTGIEPINIVVVGESSAVGEPYEPWLSVGQIVAWRLEKVFPDRPIEVVMKAVGGLCLEQAIDKLQNLTLKPDVMIIYAGHNEFQTRYGWQRNGAYYDDETDPKSVAQQLIDRLSRHSRVVKLASETLDRQRVDVKPQPLGGRGLVDRPTFSPDEREFLRTDFHERLDGIAAYCGRIGALPVLIVPSGNEADLPPNRSYVPAHFSTAERAAFEEAALRAIAQEMGDPQAAIAAYQKLLAQAPMFAEAHYRLAKLLDAAGRSDEAREHFGHALDFDGLPMRCPSDFREAYFEVARRHPHVLLIDGPTILRAFHPRGLLGGTQLHDGQHPNLKSYTALANAVLDGLRERHALGWPEASPSPTTTPRSVADHFQLDAQRWKQILERTAGFYMRTALLRYESSATDQNARRYEEAARKAAAGVPIEELDIGDVGLRKRKE